MSRRVAALGAVLNSSAPRSAAAAVPVSLVVVTADGERTIVIDRTPFTIGRKSTNILCLPDPHVSREQAVIDRRGEAYYLEDRKSTHGTLVNGVRVVEHKLNAGDTIQFGGTAAVRLIFAPERSTHKVREFLTQAFTQESTGEAAELERLALCLQVARNLNGAGVLDEILATVVDATLRLTRAERGFIFLVDSSSNELRLAVARDQHGNSIPDDSTVSHSIISRALSSGSEFLIGDTSGASEWAGQKSIVAHDLRTVICIPLKGNRGRAGVRTIEGILYLDSRFVSRDLGGVSQDLLESVSAQAATLLENAKLAAIEQEARRYEQELAISSAIQQGLMNITVPEVDFARFRGRSIPCRAVGGDFFDVVATQDCVSAVLADVSGKGISAALLASNLQGLVYAELTSRRPLAEIAELANRLICQKELSGKYATMVIARLYRDGRVEVLNCGHVPPCVIGQQKSRRLTESNLPVGLIEGAGYATSEFRVADGERIVIVSDGVTEAQDSSGEFFGDERLELSACAGADLDSIFSAVDVFRGVHALDDDCSAVELTYRAPA